MPPQALVDALGRAVEGDIGIGRLAGTLHREAAAGMDGDLGHEEMALAAEHDMRLGRLAEIAFDDGER